MKDVISSIVGVCVMIFVLFSIMSEVPDSFRHEGFFFDKYPSWMDVVFAFGAAIISMISGFVSGCIAYAVLDNRSIKLWITNGIQRYRDRSIHKFN